jgi:tetratricopeptide (TPR) repeat protein
MMPAPALHPRWPPPQLPQALAPPGQWSLMPSSLLPALLFSLLAVLPRQAVAEAVAGTCGQLIHHDQGGDYTNADDRPGLAVVEQFHFTSDVERLVRGVSDTLGGDIGYTLEHFPNHHRALAAMARLGLRDKTSKPHGARYSVECYFDRALRQKPDDPKVHALFGGYLLALGQADAALEQLQSAAQLAPSDATAHYNLGLLYLRRKNYAQARASAQQAYTLGFPLPGLKNKLVAAGQWQDP